MLNSVIQEALAKYDTKKGYGRFLKEEPHMGQFRVFAKKVVTDLAKPVPKEEQRPLTPGELLELAEILRGKKKREDSETATIFLGLTEHFGGYEALDLLFNFQKLNKEFVVFLVNNPTNALELVRALVDLPFSSSDIDSLMNATTKMVPEDKLSFYKYLQGQYKKKTLTPTLQSSFKSYVNLLRFLDDHHIAVVGIGKLLTNARKVDEALSILTTLFEAQQQKKEGEQSQLTALNTTLVTRVLALKNPADFGKLLRLVPFTAVNLELLFTADSKLHQHQWIDQVIKNFNEAQWPVSTYLKRILDQGEYALLITKATDTLKSMGINSKFINKILDFLFKHPTRSEFFVAGMKLLNETTEKGLQEGDLDILISVPVNPYSVATAMVTLRKNGIYNTMRLEHIRASPQYALEIANFEVEVFKFEKALIKYPWLDIIDAMLLHPQSAVFLTPIIKFWADNQLPAAGLLTVAKAKISSPALLQLLNTLKKVNMLNSPVLELVFPHMKYIKSLASAAKCLEQAGKLDKNNFESLISQPQCAVSAAKVLGGKANSAAKIPIPDEGAKNISEIRTMATVLAQGHRNNRFFKSTSKDPVEFEKRTHKTIAQVQKDTLIRIVELSCSQALEPEVLHQEAINAFDRPRLR